MTPGCACALYKYRALELAAGFGRTNLGDIGKTGLPPTICAYGHTSAAFSGLRCSHPSSKRLCIRGSLAMPQHRAAARTLSFPNRRLDVEGVSSIRVHAVNQVAVGETAVEIRGLLQPGEIVNVTHGRNHARFFVSWVGRAGTPQESHIRLQSLASGKYMWDVVVSEGCESPALHP